MDKDEITKLPERMTSEEIDALTTGEETPEKEEEALAQEALDATKSSPAEETVSTDEEEGPDFSEDQQQLRAKDSKIASQKHELRDFAVENARLQGQLEARKELQVEVKELVKSPLEIAEAAYLEENRKMEGFAMDGDLYRRQRAFDDEQAETKAATKEQQKSSTALESAAQTLQESDLSLEKMGEGLDYQSVSNLGDKYLTRGDLIDLADIQGKRGSSAALKESYKIMTRRILAAGNEDSRLLQSAISKSQTKPKKVKTDIDALTTEGNEEKTGEAETGTHSQRLTDFVFSP